MVREVSIQYLENLIALKNEYEKLWEFTLTNQVKALRGQNVVPVQQYLKDVIICSCGNIIKLPQLSDPPMATMQHTCPVCGNTITISPIDIVDEKEHEMYTRLKITASKPAFIVEGRWIVETKPPVILVSNAAENTASLWNRYREAERRISEIREEFEKAIPILRSVYREEVVLIDVITGEKIQPRSPEYSYWWEVANKLLDWLREEFGYK